jgi:hypothetical protein
MKLIYSLRLTNNVTVMCDFVDYDMRYNLRARNKIAELEDEGLFVEEETQQRREQPIELIAT